MNNISVVGAGTMGNGIAQIFAVKGFNVSLIDIDENALQRALNSIEKSLDRQVEKGRMTKEAKGEAIRNLSSFKDISEGVKNCDLAIEAVTENINVKSKIFELLDDHCPSQAILASNTSSISITKLGSLSKTPSRVIGMHFFNPVPIMKLVEIIKGYETSDEVASKVFSLAESLEKVPVMANDYPGFVANRILLPMINEAIIALHEGVAGVGEIDQVMKLGMGHPMGPLQLADFIGLDVCLAILEVLRDGFGNPKYAPCPLLINMVNAGRLGKKTGQGFYSYNN